ncbi:MAG: hypothetical protein MRY63_01900 [Neomegalonema sp.]|nr:hypothetical protein [Neomegalonema sp.]
MSTDYSVLVSERKFDINFVHRLTTGGPHDNNGPEPAMVPSQPCGNCRIRPDVGENQFLTLPLPAAMRVQPWSKTTIF